MPLPDHKPKKSELIRDLLDFVFGFKNNRGEILDAWIYSAEGLSLSGSEFYAAIEQRNILTCIGMHIAHANNA